MTRRRVWAAYALLAVSPALAAEPFDGRWVADLSACADEGPAASPLVVTSRSLTWTGAACMVGTSYRVGDHLSVVPRNDPRLGACAAGGAASMPVILSGFLGWPS